MTLTFRSVKLKSVVFYVIHVFDLIVSLLIKLVGYKLEL